MLIKNGFRLPLGYLQRIHKHFCENQFEKWYYLKLCTTSVYKGEKKKHVYI